MNTADQLVAAVRVEWWKLRRSPVTWTTTALIVLFMPLLGAAFYSVAINGGSGALAAKAQIFLLVPGWPGFLGMIGQIAAAAALVGVGVVVSWVFGREHAEGQFSALYALPVGRHVIALAKMLVVLGWVVALSIAVVITTRIAGELTVGDGSPSLSGFVDLGTVMVLTGISGVSVAFFASAGRGYLPGVGATILLIIAAQFSVLFGTGAWFPPAVPGLIAVRDAPGVPTVSAIQIVAVPLLAIAVGVLTVRWWARAETV